MKPDLIDISAAQTPSSIAWDKVKSAGIIGAYVRAGIGLTLDAACTLHVQGAAAQHLPFGLYWYWQTDHDPEKQAALLAQRHRDLACELAPAVDVEENRGKLPREDIAPLLMRFLLKLDELTQSRGIIYTGPAFWNQNFAWKPGAPDDAAIAFQNRALWLANYGVKMPEIPWPWDEFTLWQYAANTIWSDGSFGPRPKTPGATAIAPPGIVPGVQGEVDCNALGNVSLADLAAGLGARTPLDFSSGDIRSRQRALRRLGVNCGKLDGLWGPSCRAALVQAQKKLGIPPDGMWSPNTEWKIAEAIQ